MYVGRNGCARVLAASDFSFLLICTQGGNRIIQVEIPATRVEGWSSWLLALFLHLGSVT